MPILEGKAARRQPPQQDLVVAAWTFLWVLVALAVHGAVTTIAGVGRQFERGADGVFVAGDLLNGGTTVVQAVAEGARAAREINGYLAGRADQR